MKVRVTEIFYSISGEGISSGIPTVFVRFSGCSLRCGKTQNKKLWCDTKYSLSPKSGKLFTIDEIIQVITSLTHCPKQIIFTGGEPLENDKKEFCVELTKKISKMRHNKKHAIIRLETNGKESIRGLRGMVFSMDYKLPGSGMEKFMNLDNLLVINERKNPFDELKFIVRDKRDFARSVEVIQKNSVTTNIIYSPVSGECSPQDLAHWVKSSCIPNSRLSLQLHKIIWGSQKGV
ncbi:MAG: 7-carboxy-7-deazaguanine synthase QueE [Leptospiraceae bacterium]|nr:7-carboxy-7-deazaguanine synthase QueE [Leptospiraceae bacterium]